MGNFTPQTTQQLATAIAIAALASIVTLTLLYSGLPFFGPVNDLTNAVSGILIIVFVWQFYPILREKSSAAAIILMLIAWAGALLIIGNSVLVAFGRMDWKLGGLYTGIGYALIGIWLTGMLLVSKEQPFLTSGLARLGLIAGVCLLFGFLAGPMLPGKLEIAFKPLAWIANIATGAGWILFPLWCWRLGVALK